MSARRREVVSVAVIVVGVLVITAVAHTSSPWRYSALPLLALLIYALAPLAGWFMEAVWREHDAKQSKPSRDVWKC